MTDLAFGDRPPWTEFYPASRLLDADDGTWLVVYPLTFGRARVGVATAAGWTGDFY